MLRAREFHQIAGRAGRAGFDVAGYVVVQAPEHVIENEKAKAKSAAKNAAPGANPKRKSKAQLKKAPEGAVVWSEQTFDKLVSGAPEPLPSRMRVDNSMLINVLARDEDAFPVLRGLLTDNHEDRRSQLRLARRALRLARSLLRSGTVTRLDEFPTSTAAATCSPSTCPTTSRSTSRWPTSPWRPSTCSTPSRRRTPWTSSR